MPMDKNGFTPPIKILKREPDNHKLSEIISPRGRGETNSNNPKPNTLELISNKKMNFLQNVTSNGYNESSHENKIKSNNSSESISILTKVGTQTNERKSERSSANLTEFLNTNGNSPRNKSIVHRIISAPNYSSLPDRKVLFSTHPERPIISYGLVVRAKDTKRWLLVKRMNNTEILALLRGDYLTYELPELVAGLSADEAKELKASIGNFDKFKILFERRVYKGNIKYGYDRIMDNQNLLEHLLNKTDFAPECEWHWPKGRVVNKETPYECSKREFTEETGISSNNLILVYPKDDNSENHLFEKKRICGITYEAKYWICELEKEEEPPIVQAKDKLCEISSRRWFSYEEAFSLLRPAKLKILVEAAQKIELS